MAANVTIDYRAWSDPRVRAFSEMSGYSFYETMGRLAGLWSRCTELQNECPGEVEIRACLGQRGVELLVDSGLGEVMGDGSIRVRGCVGRHEWYGNVKPGAPRQTHGGKARAANAQRDARGRLLPRNAGGAGPSNQSSNSSNSSSNRDSGSGTSVDAGDLLDVAGPATHQQPSNRPASESDLSRRDLSRARAIPPSPEPVAPSPTEPQTLTLAQRQKINSDVWEAARRAHEGLRSAGIDRHARAWTAMPTGAGATELAARTVELAEQLGTEAAVREKHASVIEVRVEEAKRLHREGRESPLQYFIPTRIYERTSFWKSAELSPQQAAQLKRAPAMRADAPREVRIVRDDHDTDRPPVHPAFRNKS